MPSPDVKTVAVERVDGGVTVLRVIENEYREDGSLRVHYDVTPEHVDGIIAKYVASGTWKNGQLPTKWHFVPNDYLDDDTDVTYRDAWKHVKDRNKPEHDMEKAKEIQRVYLRKARLADFCRLDNDYRIADETGDVEAKKRIGAEKQRLRDVTEHPRIKAARTIEDLKLLRLKELVPEAQEVSYMDKMRVNTALKAMKER